MNKKILMFVAAALCCCCVDAVVVQKIILKNGSVLNGYIQQQDGNGGMTVSTDNAIICLENKNVTVNDNQRNINTLPEVWKEWAEKNDAFNGLGDRRTLSLSNVSVSMGQSVDSVVGGKRKIPSFEQRLKREKIGFNDVRILETGTNIKFLEMSPNVYHVTWSDIASIRTEKRAKNVLSGLERTYELANGSKVMGEYAGETENTVSVWNKNGYAETVNFADINVVTISGINQQQSIFEQTPLLDKVVKTDDTPIVGLITEYNYKGKKQADRYITVWQEGYSPRPIKMSEIKSLEKIINNKCDIKTDIILQSGDVRLNRDTVSFTTVKEDEDMLYVDGKTYIKELRLEKGMPTVLSLEYYADDKPNTAQFVLVKVAKATMKKKPVYRFTYKDLVNNVVNTKSVETSVNNTTRCDYEVSTPGVYAFYDSKQKRVIMIKVVQ